MILRYSLIGSDRLIADDREPVQLTCVDWRTGWSLNKSRKWLWNRLRNIGDRYGRRWNSGGGLNFGKAPEPGRANCIWRRRSRIEERLDGRRISQMPND